MIIYDNAREREETLIHGNVSQAYRRRRKEINASLNPRYFIHGLLGFCNGSTMRGADGRTYSEHSMSPSYSRIELCLRTKYCAFWLGRTGGAMVEIFSLSRFVTGSIKNRRL